MKKILLVLTMIAASVFLAQPAVANEPETASAADTSKDEPAAEPTADPKPDPAPAPEPPKVEEPPPVTEPEPPKQDEGSTEETPGTETTDGESEELSDPDAPVTEETEAGADLSEAASDRIVAQVIVTGDVTICHAPPGNPDNLQQLTVDYHSIIEDDGHSNHADDIIPAFEYDDSGTIVEYPGQNLDRLDDCRALGSDAIATEDPTVTAPTCDAPGALVLPETEGVVYTVDPELDGPGTYTVTAEAADPIDTLTGQTVWEDLTVLPQLTGPQCDIVAPPQPATAGVSVTDATCSADGELVFNDDDNIIYFVLPWFFENSYFVAAIPEPGYYLTNPLFFDVVVIPQELTGEQCDSTDITICHRTNSNVNPYVSQGPDTAGIANGHDEEHEGPVWNPTLKDDGIEWGDIIPPYTYEDVDYPGQNWTAEGIAFYNGGACDGAGIEPEEITAEPPLVDPATCEEDGSLTLPETPNVTYAVEPEFDGPGDYTVTASVTDEEFVLVGQTVFDVTVDEQLPLDECVGPNDPEEDPKAREDELLPDTGGLPLWVLLLAGPMTAAGLLILMRREPVSYASTSGRMPSYSLALPPVKRPAGINRVHASTEHISFMKAVGNVVAAVGRFFRGGRR